ncbi:NAD(P)/FAD-dependent oxidoreductase [Paenibacillus oenotherae]|uniref:NAD(P)/FAD-dependent oxidoreductase n=1 Tax=Paenibacillus oenotherae TaxID=1435645 RepID=A0ABS7D5A5_9BACL|nr:NAD(P)/FAD-dependent oxidoreductase [Paenibacillus oenotherae]MBW7475090.1 NAD(P)/FAD-dependent oxidoreductase [Paenibacillus oenotherae]
MYDAIIIGAGLGGLTAGSILAKNGYKVLMLEKHRIVGGFATIFRRKKWAFDVSLHSLCGLAEGGRMNKIFHDLGILDKVKFHRSTVLYKAWFPDFEIHADGDLEVYKSTLFAHFPEEREGINGLFDTFLQIRDEILNPKGPIDALKKYHEATLQDMINEFITDLRLQSIIGQLSGYFSLPPAELSGIMFAYAWTDYHIYGGFYPDGRSQDISNALRDVILENNGLILTGEEVTEIKIDGTALKTVHTKKGGVYQASKVISNADPLQTLSLVKSDNPISKRFVDRVSGIVPSYSCIQLYLIVDCNFAEEYDERNHEVFVNEDYHINGVTEHISNGHYDKMSYCITLYDNLVPNYQQADGSTIILTQWVDYEDWAHLSEEDYTDKKRKLTDLLIARLEKLYPSISTKILHAELATPKTVKRYTNHYNGAVYGAAPTVAQSMNRGVSPVTPIKDLFLIGGWVRPGAGYSGVISGGYDLANLMLANK